MFLSGKKHLYFYLWFYLLIALLPSVTVRAEHVPANWDDMELHKWYEAAELSPKVNYLHLDPFVPGRMFGFVREQKVSSIDYYLAYSLDSGVTWIDLDESFEHTHGFCDYEFQMDFQYGEEPTFYLGVNNYDSLYTSHCLYRRHGLNGNWTLVKQFSEFDRNISGLCLSVGPDGIIFLALGRVNLESSFTQFVRSVDQGVTWNTVWQHDGRSLVHGFSYSPHNSDEILAYSAIRYNQLLRSMDGGNSWENLNFNVPTLPQDGIINAIFHPSNPDIYFVIMGEYSVEIPSCIQISLDRGQTWSDFGPYNENEMLSISNLFIDPDDNDLIICAGQSLDSYYGPDIWVSRDGGNNWEGKLDYNNEANNQPVKLICSPWDSGCFYLNTKHLFKSTDNGETWLLSHPSDSFYTPTVYFDTSRMGLALLFQDGLGCFWSKDQCQTWQTSIIHHTGRSFTELSPTRDCENPDILYMTPDPDSKSEYPQMIYRTLDFGRNWYPMSLPDQMSGWYVNASKHKAGAVYVLAGTGYEAGTRAYVSHDYGESWEKLPLPDGYIFNDICDQYIESDVIYVLGSKTTTDESHFFRSIDSGISWQKIGSEQGFDGLGIKRTTRGSITLHPINPNIIFLGMGTFYESHDNGLTYTRIEWGSFYKNTHYIHPDFPEIEITSTRFTRDGRVTFSTSEASSGRSGIFMFRHCQDFLINGSIMRIDNIGPRIQVAGFGRTKLRQGELTELQIYAYAIDPNELDEVEHLEVCLDGYPTGFRIEADAMVSEGFFIYSMPVSPTIPWFGILQLKAMDKYGNLGSIWPEYAQ